MLALPLLGAGLAFLQQCRDLSPGLQSDQPCSVSMQMHDQVGPMIRCLTNMLCTRVLYSMLTTGMQSCQCNLPQQQVIVLHKQLDLMADE